MTLSDGAFTNAKLPIGRWLKNRFDDLKYTGRNDPQNPIKFLRRFEKIARYEEVGTRKQLYYFGKCLKGTAANWFDVRDPDNICGAKEAFTEYYWGEEPQNRFREEIYNGNYSYDANTSMSEYALNLAKQTKFLTPPMSDIHSETIRCIKRHFGASVAREIRPSTVKTIENFVTLLDEIDYEQKRERKIKARSEDSGSKSDFAKGKNAAGNKYPSKDTNAGANKQTIPYAKYGSNYAKQGKTDYAERDSTGKILNNATINNASCNKDGNADDKKFASVNQDTSKPNKNEMYDKRNFAASKKVAALETISEVSESEEDSNEEEKRVAIMRTSEIINDVDEVTSEDQGKSLQKSRPYVTVTIDDLPVKTLIDLGAQISAMTKSLYDKIANTGRIMRIIPIKKFTLIGAFSDRGQPIANRIQLSFIMNGREFTHELYVVRNLAYEMILGHDFLSDQTATLKCDLSKFVLDFPEIDANKIELNAIEIEDARRQIRVIMENNAELFNDEVGCVTHYQHRIEMNVDRLYKGKTYPIPEIHRERMKEHLLELEDIRIIERAVTQYVNPLVVVVKKTGKIRLCLDVREINRRMSNDHDQPPTIDEVFRRIGDKRYYSTLDIAKANTFNGRE